MPFSVPQNVTDAHLAQALEAVPRIARLKGSPDTKLAGVIAAAICVTEQRDDLLEALKGVLPYIDTCNAAHRELQAAASALAAEVEGHIRRTKEGGDG